VAGVWNDYGLTANGTLYGTTAGGGSGGTVFAITP
jgi:hypothetical protein